MNSQSILKAIQSKVIDYTLLGGLSRPDAEAKAVKAVAADLKLNKLPKLPKEATSSPKPGHVDDAQVKADAAYMRQVLLQPLNVEITGIYAEGDIADFTDEQLEQAVKDFGFAP
jgi:hypothetical protein